MKKNKRNRRIDIHEMSKIYLSKEFEECLDGGENE